MTDGAINAYTVQVPKERRRRRPVWRSSPTTLFADRDQTNIVSWNRHDRGSHFATRDATDLLVADIRAFYRPLR